MTDARLQELIDVHDIRETLAGYCTRIDEAAVNEVVQLFTEDCSTDYGPGRGGVVRGRQAYRDRIAQAASRFTRTHHQLGHSHIDVDGDTAKATTYVSAFHEFPDGDQSWVGARYEDELARVDGRWLIRHRLVLTMAVQGSMGQAGWNWLERLPPEPEAVERLGDARF